MRDKIIYFIEFIVGILILLFFQDYTLNVIDNFGINLSNYSNQTIVIIMFGIQVVLCAILYYLFVRRLTY